MPNPNSTLRFEDVKFRSALKVHANSTFLGYADATLVVDDGIYAEEPLMLRIRGIQVKILNGKFRMDLPQEKGNDGVWYPSVFPKSAATRTALTAALFADRVINAVAICTMEDQVRDDEAAAQQSAAAHALREELAKLAS